MAEGSACSPGGAPPKPILVVHKGRGQIQSQLPPDEFSLGSRKFSWLAIDSLFKDGDEWVVSLLDGERFAGKPAGLPSVSFGAGRTTQLATADRIEMRLENAPSTEVAYELQSHRGPKVFTPIRGRLRIKNTPRGLTPSFDQPIVRTQIDQPIVIEAVVPEVLVAGGLAERPRLVAAERVLRLAWRTNGAATSWSMANRGTSSKAHASVADPFRRPRDARSTCSGHARRATVRTTRNASR